MKAHRAVEVWLHLFLILAVEAGTQLISSPVAYPPGKKPLNTRLGGPQSVRTFWRRKKSLSLTGNRGPVSSVCIATGYGLDGPGIESRWWRDLPHISRSALGSTQPPLQWVPCFPRGKERPGRDADPSPPSNVVFKKE